MKKYLLWAAGLYFLFRAVSSNKNGEVSPITRDWLNADEKVTMKWADIAMRWGVAMGMDPALIMGCIYSESSGIENRTRWESERGESSYGLMQVLWSTAQDILGWLKEENYGINPSYSLTESDLVNPNFNIMLGTRYLVKQYLRYASALGKDRVYSMFAAYNAGTARKNAAGQFIDSAGNIRVNTYVQKCVNAAQRFRAILIVEYPTYAAAFPMSTWQYSGF